MGFDVHHICMKDGGPGTFSAQIVRDAFKPFIKSRDEDSRILSFPDGGGGEMLGEDDDTEETGGVSIDHVSGGDIYDALFEVLRQTNSILTWSFGGCVVTNRRRRLTARR